MCLLRQKPESIERMDKLGQLTMDDAMKRLLQSLRTEHGAYSEVFIHSPAGSGIGRLIVDPVSLLLFSSRAEDFNAINAKRTAGLSVSEAIDGSAVELLESAYDEAPGTALGRGGTRTVRLAARLPGNEEVRLKLRRPWEPPDRALARLGVTIRVR